MVLPNSWGLSLEGLRNLLAPLEERLTLVYFDPRGMGESSPIREESDMGMAAVRADFQALREHLGLDSVNAIGWSNGAMNLIVLAAERPETIDAAIFLHGAASFTEEDNAAMAAEYPELIEAWRTMLQEMQNPDLSDDQKTEIMRAMWLGEWFPTQLRRSVRRTRPPSIESSETPSSAGPTPTTHNESNPNSTLVTCCRRSPPDAW